MKTLAQVKPDLHLLYWIVGKFIIAPSVNFCNYYFVKGGIYLKDKWTGRLIGRMHNEEVTRSELAEELGVKKSYISMILNCDRRPPDAQQRLEAGVDAIIERRKKLKA